MNMINLLNQLEKLLAMKIEENTLQLDAFRYYEVLLQIEEELNGIKDDIEKYTFHLVYEKDATSGYTDGKIIIFLQNDNEVLNYIYHIILNRDWIAPGVIIQKIEEIVNYTYKSDQKDGWELKEQWEEKYARLKREENQRRILEINEEIKKLILEKEELQETEFNHI